MTAVLQLDNITHTYHQGSKDITVLHDFSLKINKGESVALVGASGAGKSTLLHIAGLLENPVNGTVKIFGHAASNERQRTKFRADYLGFVYQAHRLLPDFSALENVMLPQLLKAKQSKQAIKELAMNLLEKLGVAHRSTHRPMMLSGGEQQRVAIARALIHSPAVLIADEPTGNLDPETADTVFKLLSDIVVERGLSLLMATHNYQLADKLSRIVKL